MDRKGRACWCSGQPQEHECVLLASSQQELGLPKAGTGLQAAGGDHALDCA